MQKRIVSVRGAYALVSILSSLTAPNRSALFMRAEPGMSNYRQKIECARVNLSLGSLM